VNVVSLLVEERQVNSYGGRDYYVNVIG